MKKQLIELFREFQVLNCFKTVANKNMVLNVQNACYGKNLRCLSYISNIKRKKYPDMHSKKVLYANFC